MPSSILPKNLQRRLHQYGTRGDSTTELMYIYTAYNNASLEMLSRPRLDWIDRLKVTQLVRHGDGWLKRRLGQRNGPLETKGISFKSPLRAEP
ncbi:hypothetical protein ElyMa_003151600 [Elysia marginata]|uniref:Uncharacterized protein n=1 Tax=Elysia marginata TaxID=1093978 RepID=A0AAV4IZ16_9GAST|nr:hypothetical protein ElyMa_003151600 [Elysia marginata]